VSAVRRLQQQGKLLSEEALKGFLRDLELSKKQTDQVIEKLQRARRVGERMRRTLKRAAADLTVQVGVDLGKSVGAAIMGLSKIQRLKKELSTLQLRQRRQRLRERISEATSPLQANTLQKQLELVSARLKKARSEAGAFGQAFEAVLGSVQDTIAGVLRRLAVMAAMRGILSGNPIQILAGMGLATGSGLVSSLDSGGYVLSDGIAKVHEGETVIPKTLTQSLKDIKELSTPNLSGLVQPAQSMPSVEPATTSINAGGQIFLKQGKAKLGADKITIPVEVVHAANRVGRRQQRRKGHRRR
jgi:hypothetical protein